MMFYQIFFSTIEDCIKYYNIRMSENYELSEAHETS